MAEIISIFKEIGLNDPQLLLIAVLFFFLLKWVLKTSEHQLKGMAAERAQWQAMIQHFAGELGKITETNKAFHEEVKEAHRYQREEHKEMISCLGRINGYRDH